MRAITNQPETEVAGCKAILEQFKFGIRDIHVKHYVCKREPTNLNEALKHANDCVAIDNWLAETTYLRVWDQDEVNELCSENKRLRQENLLLKRSQPETMPYVAATPPGNIVLKLQVAAIQPVLSLKLTRLWLREVVLQPATAPDHLQLYHRCCYNAYRLQLPAQKNRSHRRIQNLLTGHPGDNRLSNVRKMTVLCDLQSHPAGATLLLQL